MSSSRAAAYAAISALKKRGLLAMDASNEEAERVIRNAETEDRRMMTRDTRRMPRMGDAEFAQAQRKEDLRDALDRCRDGDLDDPEELKDLIEAISESHPQVMSEVMHEMARDTTRGPRGWAKDRRERRSAEDVLRARDARRRAKDARFRHARRMGSDDPESFPGMPRTGGSMVPDRDAPIEEFAGNRNWEERGHGTPAEDRRRVHAADMALDQGDSRTAFDLWLPGAAQIGKV